MIIALFTILLCLYLFFGFYVLVLNYKEKLNRIFFLISISYSIACVGAIAMQMNITIQAGQNWFIFSSVFYNLNWYLMLIFSLNLTKIFKLKWYIYLGFSIPVIYMIFEFLNVSHIVDFEVLNNIKYVLRFSDSSFYMINLINVVNFSYLIFSVIILIFGYRRSSQIRLRKQIIIIVISQILSVVLAFIDHVVLFAWTDVFSSRIPGIVLFYSLFWIIGIWISLIKYRLMALTPALISRDIISNIDESLILLNPEMNIITLNDKTKELILSKNNCRNKHFSCLIAEHEKIEEELKKIKNGDITNFSCRVNFLNNEGEKIYMDAKFKLIKDKFNDIIGYLIIANEVKELKQLRNNFKITGREANVIQSVLAGKTNHEIAKELNITDRTVKSHITHIFNKLCVDKALV